MEKRLLKTVIALLLCFSPFFNLSLAQSFGDKQGVFESKKSHQVHVKRSFNKWQLLRQCHYQLPFRLPVPYINREFSRSAAEPQLQSTHNFNYTGFQPFAFAGGLYD